MGNRAAITTKGSTAGIYVHWNGGIESVLGFTLAAQDLGVRSPASDDLYFLGRLAQIIGNFFGGTLSLGVGDVDSMDNSDNGVWEVLDFDLIKQGDVIYSRSSLTGRGLDVCDGIRKQIVESQRAIFECDAYRTYFKTKLVLMKD